MSEAIAELADRVRVLENEVRTTPLFSANAVSYSVAQYSDIEKLQQLGTPEAIAELSGIERTQKLLLENKYIPCRGKCECWDIQYINSNVAISTPCFLPACPGPPSTSEVLTVD